MDKVQQAQWISSLTELPHPTPFKVTNLAYPRYKALLFHKLFPNIEIFYAVKSCNDNEVIKAIDPHVSGYDIASAGELEQLQSMGIDTSRLLYSNPVKVETHIAQAHKAGVTYFAFDSKDEVAKLAKNAPGSNVYLRLKVSDYGSKFPLSKKFGVEPLHAIAYAGLAAEAGLQMRGLAFHVGSQSENPKTWESAFATCGDLIKKLKNAGIEIDFINIGGGLPVKYTDKIAPIKEIAQVINGAIEKYIPAGMRIVAEPGRFLSAESSVIVSTIIAREHRASIDWLYLDMGVFQGLMEPLEMRNWKYPIFTEYGYKAEGFSQPFALTGPTCDAYDTLGFEYMLPSTLKAGNKLFIGAAGAYTSVYESRFNGFEPPKTYYIDKTIV